jgi:hypothetical protein
MKSNTLELQKPLTGGVTSFKTMPCFGRAIDTFRCEN